MYHYRSCDADLIKRVKKWLKKGKKVRKNSPDKTLFLRIRELQRFSATVEALEADLAKYKIEQFDPTDSLSNTVKKIKARIEDRINRFAQLARELNNG